MAWVNSHQRALFLAALGDDGAMTAIAAAGLTVRPLNLSIERLWFWAPDDQWCEWKRHLRAAGRRATFAVAVAVASETVAFYAQMRDDHRLEEILTELTDAVQSGRLPTARDVSRYEAALKDFDSTVREPGIPYRARTSLSAAIEASYVAVATRFTVNCRRSLWWSFLVLAPPGNLNGRDQEVANLMLVRARAALQSLA
jgi:hypothetical protein